MNMQFEPLAVAYEQAIIEKVNFSRQRLGRSSLIRSQGLDQLAMEIARHSPAPSTGVPELGPHFPGEKIAEAAGALVPLGEYELWGGWFISHPSEISSVSGFWEPRLPYFGIYVRYLQSGDKLYSPYEKRVETVMIVLSEHDIPYMPGWSNEGGLQAPP